MRNKQHGKRYYEIICEYNKEIREKVIRVHGFRLKHVFLIHDKHTSKVSFLTIVLHAPLIQGRTCN